jgi:hypothetical protein
MNGERGTKCKGIFFSDSPVRPANLPVFHTGIICLSDFIPFLIGFYKGCQRSVICAFNIVREKAGRDLIHPEMISQAFTAVPFSAAWFITAVTVFHVTGNCTFTHDSSYLVQAFPALSRSIYRDSQDTSLFVNSAFIQSFLSLVFQGFLTYIYHKYLFKPRIHHREFLP